MSLWPSVVGKEIAARTTAVSVDDGVLHVRVEHSVWLQELYFMERQILRRLKEAAPEVNCERIRFSAGR